MIQLLFFLLVGAALLSALLFLGGRQSPHARAEGNSHHLVDARKALDALQGELLPQPLVQRIFAREDLDYMVSLAMPRAVRDLFVHERRKIALLWIDQVRCQVSNLRRFHVGAARSYAQLGLRTEFALGCHFAALLCACSALRAAVYVAGPYAAPRIVDATASAAAGVCSISEQALAFLNPVQLKPSVSNSLSS